MRRTRSSCALHHQLLYTYIILSCGAPPPLVFAMIIFLFIFSARALVPSGGKCTTAGIDISIPLHKIHIYGDRALRGALHIYILYRALTGRRTARLHLEIYVKDEGREVRGPLHIRDRV